MASVEGKTGRFSAEIPKADERRLSRALERPDGHGDRVLRAARPRSCKGEQGDEDDDAAAS
jgi:hypothetical protein